MPTLPFKLPSLTTLGVGLLVLLLVVQTVRIEGLVIWPLHIHGLQEQLDTERTVHAADLKAAQQTVQNYRTGAINAGLQDAANAARVRAEQAVINERTESEYQARLANARARADSLRPHTNAGAHPGHPAAAGVSDADPTPGDPDGAAAEDGFSVDDRLIATEQAIQLDELQRWVRANVDVRYSVRDPDLDRDEQ